MSLSATLKSGLKKEVNKLLNGGDSSHGGSGGGQQYNNYNNGNPQGNNMYGNGYGGGMNGGQMYGSYGSYAQPSNTHGNGYDTGIISNDSVNNNSYPNSYGSGMGDGQLASNNPYANHSGPNMGYNGGRVEPPPAYSPHMGGGNGGNGGNGMLGMMGTGTSNPQGNHTSTSSTSGFGGMLGMPIVPTSTQGNYTGSANASGNYMGGYGSMGMVGGNNSPIGGPCILAVKPTKAGSQKVLVVTRSDAPPNAAPAYTVEPERVTSPNVVVYRGPPEANQIVATADTGKMSGGIPMTLRGQPMSLKISSSGSGRSTVSTPLGEFKWKPNELSDSGPGFYDAHDTLLARYKGGLGSSKGKKLNVMVRCDDILIEIMLISVIITKQDNKASVEAVFEILQAVAGG